MLLAAVDDIVLRDAARVTLAYLIVFVLSIGLQVYGKVVAIKAHKKAKAEAASSVSGASMPAPFNRYSPTDATLLAADRVVGNFLEWAPAFLGLFWLSIVFAGKGIEVGWLYVALRVVYAVLAVNGGLAPSGARPLIFVATVPMYCVLSVLAYNVFLAVM
jgi:hypothetical protein